MPFLVEYEAAGFNETHLEGVEVHRRRQLFERVLGVESGLIQVDAGKWIGLVPNALVKVCNLALRDLRGLPDGRAVRNGDRLEVRLDRLGFATALRNRCFVFCRHGHGPGLLFIAGSHVGMPTLPAWSDDVPLPWGVHGSP